MNFLTEFSTALLIGFCVVCRVGFEWALPVVSWFVFSWQTALIINVIFFAWQILGLFLPKKL